MRNLSSRHSRFWSSDRSLSGLLVILVIGIFVLYPLGEIGVLGDVVLELVFSLLLISGVMSVTRNRIATVIICFIAAATIFCGWLGLFYPSALLSGFRYFFGILSLGLMVAIIMIDVFREGEINFHRIQGAIAGYLLLGILLAVTYRLIALLEPGSFMRGTHPVSGVFSDGSLMHAFLFFSFSTLTTIDYSDVVAVNPLARSLVIVEALIGQLFPAILLARLVSMEVSSRETRSRKSDSGESSIEYRQNLDRANQQRENLSQLLPTRSKHAV